MLVLSRKINERIQIGDEITITVVRMSAGSVRIGIEAPSHLQILREELASGECAAGPCLRGKVAADEAGRLVHRAS